MINEISRREQKTIFTLVEFTFDCGCKIEADIAHFMPKDEEEVQLGINNRYITEERQHVCPPEEIIEEGVE